MDRPTGLKTEQLDMESFFDFNQGITQPSPANGTSSKVDFTPKSANQTHDWNAISPFDQQEERQQFNGPSHDYTQYKQQVGLPVGSMVNMPPVNSSNATYDGFGSGIGDSGFDGWGSGLDMDSEMSMDFNNMHSAMPAMFFPGPANDSQSDSFVNPNTLGGQDEPVSNVGRLWPGMHSQQAQQAAMQKAAQSQGVQQRQTRLQSSHVPFRQVTNAVPSQGSPHDGSSSSTSQAKHASPVSEAHVEESISRLLNQMRQNGAMSVNSDDDGSGMLPHIARMKKDEEEMDEDERLLASDEGKKLSSKERRQLRNKVSARAFRSRRKEYISQLEGEVAMKAQESTTLRSENNALLQENERYRSLIETLLRHPAFTPFINDISQDPSVLNPSQPQPQLQSQQTITSSSQPAQSQSQPQSQPQQQQQETHQQQQPQPKPQHQLASQQETNFDFMNFDASQLQIPQEQQQRQSEQVGMVMTPENDFSKLNINNFNSMNFNGFQSVNAFAVTQLPEGPDPAQLLAEMPVHSYSTNYLASNDFTGNDLTTLLSKLDNAARSLKST